MNRIYRWHAVIQVEDENGDEVNFFYLCDRNQWEIINLIGRGFSDGEVMEEEDDER